MTTVQVNTPAKKQKTKNASSETSENDAVRIQRILLWSTKETPYKTMRSVKIYGFNPLLYGKCGKHYCVLGEFERYKSMSDEEWALKMIDLHESFADQVEAPYGSVNFHEYEKKNEHLLLSTMKWCSIVHKYYETREKQDGDEYFFYDKKIKEYFAR